MTTCITSGRGRAWHSHLTVDFCAEILTRSIFHPFVAWCIPLCLRAVATPYHNPEFIAVCIFAALVTSVWIFGVVNKRLAYGTPREVDWDEEVVVITGGASGLGKTIAQMFGMRGASVAILDVQEPKKESEGFAGVLFYQCDVGDAAAVARVRDEIQRDLGTPTILINNAGVVNAKRLWDLTSEDLQRNFSVNLVSHFNTIRTFLPGMLASEVGGTIVTVSSVLGKLGASYLSDYTAAKAGLIAMHTSLCSELASASAPEGAENIRTILVAPGQLSTPLFAGLETPSNFFGPVVEPVELAREIVSMIDHGWSGQISLPLYARWIQWMHVLPASFQKLARYLSGIDQAMESSKNQGGHISGQ